MNEHNNFERYRIVPPDTVGKETWWSQYFSKLTYLSETAKKALDADCNYIVNKGIFGAGKPGSELWPIGNRTGLVMGSVQSGKTASMLGVSALSLDMGIDILIVLSGTRLSLWRQTYDRFTRQLDTGQVDGAQKRKSRALVPKTGNLNEDSRSSLSTLYGLPMASAKRLLTNNRPIIFIAMKQANHLHALSQSLRDNVFKPIKELGRPIQMLVLDDEADDGSILDAAVERGLDPATDNLKQIPRLIANLWDPPGKAPENLFSTYIAYTATPQACLLQESHNPLSAKDFLVSLRTPLDRGEPVIADTSEADPTVERTSTYPEPKGVNSYYTGGEIFYNRCNDANLCISTDGYEDDGLAEAMRAFLVGSAIILYRSNKIGPYTAASLAFERKEDFENQVCSPRSMLFHPSAKIHEHFEGARTISEWAGQTSEEFWEQIASKEARLPSSLLEKIDQEEDLWAAWIEKFRDSAEKISVDLDCEKDFDFPTWEKVRELLETEIIPGTRVSVINSDPSAYDKPEFEPTEDPETGKWKAPRDLSTIFVSGNVMARGLTLEGLTTTLFHRTSQLPFADTQMQMQRWFGYRGSYIEFCRLFAEEKQIQQFRIYHNQDEAIRTSILEGMKNLAPQPTVLQGKNFLATGKIANLGTLPLNPGPKPFIPLINSGEQRDPNERLIADLFSNRASSDLVAGKTTRGRILNEPLQLKEAAELLGRLSYEDYVPGSSSDIARYWDDVQVRVEALGKLHSGKLYMPPGGPDSNSGIIGDCPYSISAYLRLWNACLTRAVTGLFVTGHPGVLWNTTDLSQKQGTQPRFWVGIRYGSGEWVEDGPLAKLTFTIPTTQKRVIDGKIQTTWGSNNPDAGPNGYRGDEFFDYYAENRFAPEIDPDTAWRPIGDDGLILFYVNQLERQRYPSIATGVCIPAGGPEQFAATKAESVDLNVSR